MNILLAGTLIILLIILVGFVLPLRLSLRSKILVSLLLFLAPSKSYLHHIVGGTAFDPNIPYNLSFIFDIGRTLVIFLAILVILRAIINFVGKVVKQSLRYSFLPTHSTFHAMIMVMFSTLLAVYGTSCAYNDPEIKEYDLTFEKLDPRLDGMKIILMSDIHISAPTNVNLIYRTVQRVNDLNADLILMPGDLIDGSVELRRPITDLLLGLKAKYGVFISTGNHEYYSGYQEWRDYFEQGGFTSLDNKVLALQDPQNKTLLNLAGITDTAALRVGLPGPDIKGVVDAINADAPAIVLSHRPEFAHEFDKSGKVDLVLSGHTHGGLVKGLDKIVADANGGFVSGLYKLKNTDLIVCNGTMIWMGFPLRIGVPPQIEVIILHAKTPAKDPSQLLTVEGDAYRKALEQKAKQEQAQKEAEQKAQAQKQAVALQQEQNTNQANGSANLDADQKSKSEDASSDNAQAQTASTEQKQEQASDLEPNAYHLNNLKDYAYNGYMEIQDKDYQNLQLVLPMKNAEDGKIVENVTNLAVLPSNLTKEQVNKISTMIAQQIEIFEQEKNQDKTKKVVQEQKVEQQKPVKAVDTLSFKLIKDDKAPAQKVDPNKQAQEQKPKANQEATKAKTNQAQANNLKSQDKVQEQSVSLDQATKQNTAYFKNKEHPSEKLLVTISSANAATIYTEDGQHHIFENEEESSTLDHNVSQLVLTAQADVQENSKAPQLTKANLEEEINAMAQAQKNNDLSIKQEPEQGLNHISIANAVNNEMAVVYSLSLTEHPLSKQDENVADLLN